MTKTATKKTTTTTKKTPKTISKAIDKPAKIPKIKPEKAKNIAAKAKVDKKV